MTKETGQVTATRRYLQESVNLRFEFQIEKITNQRDGMRGAVESNWSVENYVNAAKCAHEAAVWNDVLFLTKKAYARYKAGSIKARGEEAVDEFLLSRLGANASHSFAGQEGDIYREATAKFLGVINLIIR